MAQQIRGFIAAAQSQADQTSTNRYIFLDRFGGYSIAESETQAWTCKDPRSFILTIKPHQFTGFLSAE
jgi:hypothetical protein